MLPSLAARLESEKVDGGVLLTRQDELLGAIKFYVDHLLNEEDPERTASYDLARCVNEYLELGIEETWYL